MMASAVEAKVKEIVCEQLGVSEDEVQPNAPDGLEALLDLDARARAAALATVRRLAA